MPRFHPKPRAIESTGDDSPAGSLTGYLLRMSGHHQIWICLLALVVATLSMAPLELQRRIINNAVELGDLDLLLLLGGLYLAVLVTQGLLKLWLRLYQGWLSESAIRYNRLHLTRLYQEELEDGRKGQGGGKEGESNEQAGSGRAVSIIGNEVDRLGGFVGEAFSQPAVNIGMIVAILGYMLVVEPTIALIALAFFVPQALLVPIVQRWINRLMERRVQYLRSFSDLVAELPEGEESTKEKDEGTSSGQLIEAIYGNRMRIFLLKFASKGAINFFNHLAPLSVLVFGGWMVVQGQTSLGVVVAFLSGFERLSDPLRELLDYYRLAAQARVQHSMIAQWM